MSAGANNLKNKCLISRPSAINSQMPGTDDMELLQDYARCGSESAFAGLVQRHIALVYSAALRHVGIAAHAEEITQAVFIILARKAGSLRADTILESWLYETTRLTALSFLRGERRRQFREQEAYMQSTLHESGDNLLWDQLAPLLDEAISRLGKKDRDAVILRFFKEKSVREVAVALQINETAAQRRTLRALEKLRKFFTKRGVSSTTAIIAGLISANSVQAAPVALAKSVTAVAIAKGAAASASTLTLIKGALKIMAWTKTKTTVAVVAGALLAAGTTTMMVKEVMASRENAIFEQIWAHPDSGKSTMNALIHAPPALIVRPTRYPASPIRGFWTDARIGHGFFVNASVANLVGGAYGIAPWRIVFPANVPPGGFDLMETLLPGQNDPALQKEIQKRFGLVAHREMSEADTLQLEVNNPARLNLHVSAGGQPSVYANGDINKPMNYIFKNQTLKEVSRGLENYFGIPITVSSSLDEHYDLTFQVDNDFEREALRQSFRHQLNQFGLKLVPGHQPVEMLMVEKVP